jgi:hypothetical protein
MSAADVEEGKALLLRLADDPDLLLLRYDMERQTKWYVNHDRTTNKGQIAPKIALWLDREGFVTEADKITQFKTVYTVTKQGLSTAHKIRLNLPTREEVKAIEPSNPQPTVQPTPTALSVRQKLILEETASLNDEDLRLLFFYGIGMLKDDIKSRAQLAKQEIDKQVEADIEKLSQMEEKLTCPI